MKFGIVVPTYKRIDGSSPEFLTRALSSIKNQTHQDYVVYLIGDKYDDNAEFEILATSIIDDTKIKYVNLLHAVEREKYQPNSNELKCAGSTNANNMGIDMALFDGISYICHLDHDDYWENNHLFEINNVIENNGEYVIIVTSSTHFKPNVVLPRHSQIPYYPRETDVIHSSTCVNFLKIPLRYRDVLSCTGTVYAGDADLWNRISAYMVNNDMIGYHIQKITCHHDIEGK